MSQYQCALNHSTLPQRKIHSLPFLKGHHATYAQPGSDNSVKNSEQQFVPNFIVNWTVAYSLIIYSKSASAPLQIRQHLQSLGQKNNEMDTKCVKFQR